MNQRTDLTGKRFGKLRITGETRRREQASGYVVHEWECACDCGGVVWRRAGRLLNGDFKNCGCEKAVRHGNARKGANTDEYRIWSGIKRRCTKETCEGYQYYGARGISVHPQWMNDFPSFLAHVGKRPSKRHSIDRIDNDGNYEPGNVRWATKVEQARNKRKRKTGYGAKLDGNNTADDIARIAGKNATTIRKRFEVGYRGADLYAPTLYHLRPSSIAKASR